MRPGGTALLFTPTATGVLTPLDLGELYFREVSLVPSYSCGPTDTRLAYELMRTEKSIPGRSSPSAFPWRKSSRRSTRRSAAERR